MARRKKEETTPASATPTSFVVQDMVPNREVLQLNSNMSTLGHLRDFIAERWNLPVWFQRLSTYPDGELSEWGNQPSATPLAVVLAGLGSDEPTISLNHPAEDDYVDIANEDDPFEIVMRSDCSQYLDERNGLGRNVKFIFFSEYKRIVVDAVDQYKMHMEETADDAHLEPQVRRQRQE